MAKRKHGRKRKPNYTPFYIFITVIIIIAVIVGILLFRGCGATPDAENGKTTTVSAKTTVTSQKNTVTTTKIDATTIKTTAVDEGNNDKTTTASPATMADGFTRSEYAPDDSTYAPSDDVSSGSLILVSNKHLYRFPDVDRSELLSTDDYAVAYDDMWYNTVAFNAMNKMISDFRNSYSDELMIVSAYRGYDSQERIWLRGVDNYGKTEAARWYSLPGGSEHHTGYAFDFRTDYDGTGNYSWINSNCYKYGFVQRYAEDKEDITKIGVEPWHFRYVGLAHAIYMVKNNLCLEEYIDLLYSYPENGKHLNITDENGTEYEVYYVKGSSKSDVKKPIGSYTDYEISGNNIDGFIVTVTK